MRQLSLLLLLSVARLCSVSGCATRSDVAKVLIENPAIVNSTDKWGRTPLHEAAWENSVFAAKLLLENSANVDSTDNHGNTPLHYAAKKNSVDVAKLLLENSADLNAIAVSGSWKGLTPLQVAENRGNQEMVELLRNAAKDCSYHEDCETAQACSQRKCMNLCFSDNCNKGVNNARDSLGWTPLHRAAKTNSVDVASLLIENSADVDSANNYGETALQVAALKNSVGVANLLIENSANVDWVDNRGQTALHRAAWKNSVDVAKLLLENSVNVDSTNKWGATALHVAAWKNSVGVAKLLIAHSANLNATVVSGRQKGLTPLQLAEKLGNQEMVELLRNA